MLRRFSTNFAVFSIFLDAVLMMLALWIADAVRWRFNDWSFVMELPRGVHVPFLLYLVFPILWVIVLLLFSVYDGRRNLRAADEFAALTMGTILGTVALAGVLYLSYRSVSRFLFLIFIVLAYLFILTWRAVYRLVYRRIRNGYELHRVLILGAGQVGCSISEHIHQRPYLGLIMTGFLDDDPEKQKNQADVLGRLDKVHTVVQEQRVDDVIIALPRSAHERLNQVVSDLHDLPVRVWIIPDYFSLALHRAAISEFAGIPLLDLRAPALSEYQRMVKRIFDLALILLGMPFILPLMGLIALAIRLEGPGSVFYCHPRAGENGRIFSMIKFRTMVVNADQLLYLVERQDEQGQMVFKSPDAQRITRVGRFLRRASLDELPQLFNVLKGEMSLVGPRPELPYLVEKYEPWQRKRFAVPQGMTGWWQVNGRSDKPLHLHPEEDLYYVQHFSLWLDVQILLKTFWVVLRGKGAY